MSDYTHDCPAPGCAERVPFERLACPPHWLSIPAQKRGRLLREYGEHFGERSYFEARAECLFALGVPDDQIAELNSHVPRREAVPQ